MTLNTSKNMACSTGNHQQVAPKLQCKVEPAPPYSRTGCWLAAQPEGSCPQPWPAPSAWRSEAWLPCTTPMPYCFFYLASLTLRNGPEAPLVWVDRTDLGPSSYTHPSPALTPSNRSRGCPGFSSSFFYARPPLPLSIHAESCPLESSPYPEDRERCL